MHYFSFSVISVTIITIITTTITIAISIINVVIIIILFYFSYDAVLISAHGIFFSLILLAISGEVRLCRLLHGT